MTLFIDIKINCNIINFLSETLQNIFLNAHALHNYLVQFNSFYINILTLNMMNSNQIVAELSSDQLKIRQLAEEYLKIEENTEFLTNIQRFQPHKKRIQMKVEQILPDVRSLAALTVQLSYLLFTCQVKQANIYISHKLYFLNPNKREAFPEACRQYILEKDLLKMPEDYQQYLLKHFTRHEFSANQERAFAEYALKFINQILLFIDTQQNNYKNPPEKFIIRQFKIMGIVIKNFIQPKIKTLPHPRVMILALEETQLFRQHSILLKVMNNSIFTAIRNSKFKNVFEQVCKMEYGLTQLKSNKSEKDAHAKQMEACIENLFRFLIRCKIMTAEQSINDQTKVEPNKNQPQNVNVNNTNTKQYVFGQVQGSTINDRKYTCRIVLNQKPIREFNQKVYDSIVVEAMNNYLNDGEQSEPKPNQSKITSKNQFLIEYMPGKGIISVKYTTAIDLNIENTDLIMFQCNSIAFHWSNVSMELVEKVPNKPVKKKERYLAFKTLSHLHISERPLFKLLIMLDLVMLCAKISEPELRKTVIRAEDYNRVEEITHKVDHMIKLFIKKIERFYKMFSESESTKISGQ